MKALQLFIGILLITITAGFFHKLWLDAQANRSVAECKVLISWLRSGTVPDDEVDESGQAISSWRLRVYANNVSLPVQPQYNLPWNSPENKYFADRSPSTFCVDADPHVKFVAVRGSGCAFDAAIDGWIDEGTVDNDTIVVVEVDQDQLHWAEAGDLYLDEVSAGQIEIGIETIGSRRGSFIIGFVNGIAWEMRSDTPRDVLSRFFTIDGARKHDRQEELSSYRIR